MKCDIPSRGDIRIGTFSLGLHARKSMVDRDVSIAEVERVLADPDSRRRDAQWRVPGYPKCWIYRRGQLVVVVVEDKEHIVSVYHDLSPSEDARLKAEVRARREAEGLIEPETVRPPRMTYTPELPAELLAELFGEPARAPVKPQKPAPVPVAATAPRAAPRAPTGPPTGIVSDGALVEYLAYWFKRYKEMGLV